MVDIWGEKCIDSISVMALGGGGNRSSSQIPSGGPHLD